MTKEFWVYFSHLQMTFAISQEIHFLAGHRFYVKLTPMNILSPYDYLYLTNFQFAVIEYFLSGTP
ncbi:hypothetical protein FACHB389_08060 [Nostoc calcicola FACHB-389]|nr:hypothetical protein [Nostoc calcicola FACHB-3891]OKH39194.1 hypothetical protein FACHB389_08060 [Nostoc calcicola FACHB-389]